MIATGLPPSTEVRNGREAQSMAFLSTPGTQWLYSGVAMSSASAPAIARFKRGDRLRIAVGLHVGVEHRQIMQVVRRDRDAGRSDLDGRPDEAAIERGAPQAAGDAEDAQRSGVHGVSPISRVRPSDVKRYARRGAAERDLLGA